LFNSLDNASILWGYDAIPWETKSDNQLTDGHMPGHRNPQQWCNLQT